MHERKTLPHPLQTLLLLHPEWKDPLAGLNEAARDLDANES